MWPNGGDPQPLALHSMRVQRHGVTRSATVVPREWRRVRSPMSCCTARLRYGRHPLAYRRAAFVPHSPTRGASIFTYLYPSYDLIIGTPEVILGRRSSRIERIAFHVNCT